VRKSRKIVFAVGTAMALTLAGCGSDKKAEEVVPTVAPTATPTIPPVTATPAPTSTPAPRKIGEKTSQSKFVYLTNNLKTDVRELYLMVSGSEDWGDNLIPREFSVKASDQVQMFYTPESVQASAEEEDSEETGAPSGALYDMKLVTADGNTYEIYSIELSDMEKASLTLDEETSTAYLRYMSLSEKKEKDTKENSQQTGYGDDYDSDDESYDDSYSDDGNYDDGSSDDGNYDDGNYDDGSSDDGNYDDGSSDDGNSDDGSSDDGNYDDGGSDDGSSDDGGSDDGNYDDGSSDSGSGDDYVDAGDGDDDGYYDTEE
jgi:hypothetical protein